MRPSSGRRPGEYDHPSTADLTQIGSGGGNLLTDRTAEVLNGPLFEELRPGAPFARPRPPRLLQGLLRHERPLVRQAINWTTLRVKHFHHPIRLENPPACDAEGAGLGVAPRCSDLGKERMLHRHEWVVLLVERLTEEPQEVVLHFLGGSAERE